MLKRLNAKIILRDRYGSVVNSPTQNITFDDKCPICGKEDLKVVRNIYYANGESYFTDNIICENKCVFRYDDLLNLKGFTRH